MGKRYVVQSDHSVMLTTEFARPIGIQSAFTTRMGHNQRNRSYGNRSSKRNYVTITNSNHPAKRIHRRDISRIIHTAETYGFNPERIVALYRGRV